MGHRPEATLFFGVEITEFWDWNDDSDEMPYDYDWEERLAAKLGIKQGETEGGYDFKQRVVREVNVTIIDAGDDSHDTLTIGIAETVVNGDWDGQEEIRPEHPIFCYEAEGERMLNSKFYWNDQLQKFCDIMLNVKVDIQALYDDGKVGWRLAAYYPSS